MALSSPSRAACIDLFAGCGGLSLGAEHAGLSISAAIEFDPSAADTYAANFPTAELLRCDIRSVEPGDLKRPRGALVVIAGPPCQPFSASNQRSRGPLHPNNTLYEEALRFIRQLKPEAVVVENVEGFGLGSSRVYHDDLCARLKGLGYLVQSKVFCAAHFGAPQLRRRLFVVGSRSPTNLDFEMSRSNNITVSDAIKDLPSLLVGQMADMLPYNDKPPSGYAAGLREGLKECLGHWVTKNAPHIVERYKFIPQGGNWRNIPPGRLDTYKDARRCHTGIYHRLHPHQPAKVIGNFRKNMLIHPYQDRGLSIREAARLQTFPDRFVFKGSIGKQQQQVGNAVPPALAKAILQRVLEGLGV